MIGDAYTSFLDDLRAADELASEVWRGETTRVAVVPTTKRQWWGVVMRECVGDCRHTTHGDHIETESYADPREALSDLVEQMRDILRQRDTDSAETIAADRQIERWKEERDDSAAE